MKCTYFISLWFSFTYTNIQYNVYYQWVKAAPIAPVPISLNVYGLIIEILRKFCLL